MWRYALTLVWIKNPVTASAKLCKVMFRAPPFRPVGPVLGYTAGKSRQKAPYIVPSGPVLDLRAYDGKIVHVSGTATVLQILPPPSGECGAVFDGACVLTHNTNSLILPGAANIATAANDVMFVAEDGDGLARVINYIRATGGSVVAPTFTAGWNLLSTVTASNSANVDIETTFDSTYDEYVILVDGVYMASGGDDMRIRMKLGGAYDSGANHNHASTGINSSAATVLTMNSGATTSIGIMNASIGATSASKFSSEIWITNPTSTVARKSIRHCSESCNASGGLSTFFSGSGSNSAVTALTGIRMFGASGNITAGTFRLYGIRKT